MLIYVMIFLEIIFHLLNLLPEYLLPVMLLNNMNLDLLIWIKIIFENLLSSNITTDKKKNAFTLMVKDEKIFFKIYAAKNTVESNDSIYIYEYCENLAKIHEESEFIFNRIIKCS